MQDVNLFAPAPAAGDALPTMDSLEFQDIAHTTPSRKAPAPAAEIPLHDMKDASGSAAFPAFDPKDVPLGQASVGDLHGGEQHGLLAAAPGGPGGAASALNMAIAGAAVSAAVSAVDRKDPSAGASFYQLAYYRTYFDVTTAQIGSRLLRAFVPTGSYFYADTAVHGSADATDDKPDLYGPFWIATTLVFLMAATGNFAEFLATSAAKVWNYDMEKVTVAATVFYSFIFPVPLVLWVYLRYIDTPKPLVTIISLYGYSLLWYLPVCVVCVAPIEWLRWLAVAVAAAMSTRFVVRNLAYFGPNLTPDQPAAAAADQPTGGDAANSVPAEKKHKLFVALCVVAVFHLGLAAVTKFYFFAFTALDEAPASTASTGVAGP